MIDAKALEEIDAILLQDLNMVACPGWVKIGSLK